MLRTVLRRSAVAAGALVELVHGFVAARGPDRVDIASHDLGSGVAWAYARAWPGEVGRMAVEDFPLPSPACPVSVINTLSYHFPLFTEPGVPELLIDDEVGPFLETFYRHVSPNPDAISAAEAAEYARTCSRTANLAGGFELYRTLGADEAANTAAAATPLDVPVLLLTQDGGPDVDVFGFSAGSCTSAGATSVVGREIAGAGHWLNEEATDEVLAELATFFGWTA